MNRAFLLKISIDQSKIQCELSWIILQNMYKAFDFSSNQVSKRIFEYRKPPGTAVGANLLQFETLFLKFVFVFFFKCNF